MRQWGEEEEKVPFWPLSPESGCQVGGSILDSKEKSGLLKPIGRQHYSRSFMRSKTKLEKVKRKRTGHKAKS